MSDRECVSIRIDVESEMYKQMKEMADRNHRSLKAQALVWCIDGFEMDRDSE